MALAGSASTFASARASHEELVRRLLEFDVHVTGPLWGNGEPAVSGEALQLENLLADEYPDLCAGPAKHGLEQERRALRAQVGNLRVQFESDGLVLEFTLERGVYATSLLRELLHPEAM